MEVPVKGTKGMPRAERERALLDAAQQAFARVGFHAATVEEIAAAAGVTKPMVYAYFGSKELLFAAGMHRAYERFLAEVESAALLPGSPRERTERVIGAVFGWAENYLDLWHYFSGAQALGGEIAREVAADRAGMTALIARFIAELAGDDARAAELEPIAEICVAINTAIIDRWARERDEPREAHEARAIWANWSLLGGLLGDEPSAVDPREAAP